MNEYNCFEWQPSIFLTAEQILAASLKMDLRLGESEPTWDAPDNCKGNVLRCEVIAGNTAAPKTVILKRIASPKIEFDPQDARPGTISWRLGTEWAVYRFLHKLDTASAVGACCYGGNRNDALLVLEDLGAGPTVDSVLMGNDPTAAEQALQAYAQTLGQFHAATSGRENIFNQFRIELGLPGTTARAEDLEHVRDHIANFRRLIGPFGNKLTPGVEVEMNGALQTLAEPGPFLVLTHGDPNPVNDLVIGETVRLYDFEYSGYRHALMDGVFNRHLYPWVRCCLPDDVLSRFEARYRRELARGCPDAEKEKQYRLEQMRARCVWMIATLNGLLERAIHEDGFEEERSGYEGIAELTLRERALVLLERFAADAELYQCMPAMTELARDLSATLNARWSIEPILLPTYPAFRTGSSSIDTDTDTDTGTSPT